MRPGDDQTSRAPSGPPPSELPRPRLKSMSDIRPAPRVQSSGSGQAISSAQAYPESLAPAASVPESPSKVDDALASLPIPSAPMGDETPPKKGRKGLKVVVGIIAGIVLLVAAAVFAAAWWYRQQLQPVSNDTTSKRVVIESGSTPSMIADTLKSAGVIRNTQAFMFYIQLSQQRDSLKAGAYTIKPSQSVPEIVDHLVSGKQDTFSITFLPGDTLANHRKRLIAAGYSESEVDTAFAKSYTSPLFEGKPASADLEGYIYGETYEFASTATVEDILMRTFEQFEAEVTSKKLVEGFKKQGLTLYQGITLASIIQREVPTAGDQKQIAAVFYNRIKAGMTLGSDVTYQYAAKKLGVAPDPTLDSPYNTRIHQGLPPGPIASPGASALEATAAPAANDYLFFLSGDDDKTYFGRTDAEHQRNIVSHCQKKCSIN